MTQRNEKRERPFIDIYNTTKNSKSQLKTEIKLLKQGEKKAKKTERKRKKLTIKKHF